jgi:hypothetical protein
MQTNLSRPAKLILLSFVMLLIPHLSYGGERDASFSWTANSEPSVLGYKLYYREGTDDTAPFNGSGLINENGQPDSSPIIIQGATTVSYTVSGLSTDKTYQFVLTAYDDNLESDNSAIATAYSNPNPTIIKIVKIPAE